MENLFADSKNEDETLEDGEITDQESCDDLNETNSINDSKNLSNDTSSNIQSNYSTSKAPSILLNNSNLSKNTLKRKFNNNDETKNEKEELNLDLKEKKNKMNLNSKNVIMFIKEMKKMMNKISDDKVKKRKVKDVKKIKKAVKKKTQIIKTNIPANNQICKYFLEGYCQKGTNCTFIHQKNIKTNKQTNNLPVQNTIKKEICKFYLQDSCDKGDECTFFHQEFPCKFFHTGIECRSGENCKFSHKPLTDQMRIALETHLNSYDVIEIKNRRVLLGEPTLQMRNSHDTWSWQQEMRKLESTYNGPKRNLFTIPNDHLIKNEPYNQQSQLIPNFYIDKNCDLDLFKQDNEKFENSIKSDNLNAMKNDFKTQNEMEVFDSQNSNYFYKMNEPFNRLDMIETKDNFKIQEQVRTLFDNNQLYQRRDTLQMNNFSVSKNNSNNFDLNLKNNLSNNLNDSLNNNLNSNLNKYKYNYLESDTKRINSNLSNENLNKKNTLQNKKNFNSKSMKKNENKNKFATNFNNNKIQKDKIENSNNTFNQINKKIKKEEYKIDQNEPFVFSECEDFKFKLYNVDIQERNFSKYESIFVNDSNASNDPRLKNYFSSKNSNSVKNEKLFDFTFLFNKNLDTNDVIPQGLSELRLKKVEN